MRAWLLLLAVLATFKPIVQVASTEDISSRFITAISPPRSTESTITTTTELTRAFNSVNDISPETSSASLSYISNSNSNSDSYLNNINKNSNNNIVIEIKNIEEIEGNEVNNNEKEPKVDNTESINQLENSKNNAVTTKTSENNQLDTIVAESKAHEMAIADSESISTTSRTAIAVPAKHHHHQHHQHHHHHHKHQHELPQQLHTHHSSSSYTTTTYAPLEQELVALDHRSHRSDLYDEEEPATYSNKEIISEKVKPDSSTLVEIENSLLSLFNMKRPPKVDRSKIFIPDAMKQMYAQIMGHELDSVNIPRPGLLTKSANTMRSFTHQNSKIDDRFPHHHRFRLHFDIGSIPAEEKLKAAELNLTRDAISHAALNPRQASRTRYQVLVYDITRVGVRGKREPSYLLLDNKTIRLNNTDTVSLDVQPAVDRWLATPKRNYGLLVEVRTMRSLKPAPHHHVRLRRSTDETHDRWQLKQPQLFTYLDDERHKSRSIRDVSTRSKRAGHSRRPHRRKNNEEICRRYSLYVDFADVGWSDWIVAPPGYDAFYCHGNCPFPLPEHLNSTNHAVVQTLVNNLNPGKVPKACCVPTQLEGIAMLYLNDQNTVVLKNYQDMTVVGCGCR